MISTDTGEQTGRGNVSVLLFWTVLSAGTAAAISSISLVGWLGHIPVLIEPWAGQATMKANTAAALLLSALSVLTLVLHERSKDSKWKAVCHVAALLAAIIGFLTILEYSTGQSFGIDQLVVQDWGSQKGTAVPGRMGLNTATLFLCFGSSQLLLGLTNRLFRKVGYTLAVLVAVAATFSLIGYLYGVPYLYKIATFSEMALSTGIAFVLLSAGVLGAYPKDGLFAVLTSKTVGGIVARRLIPTAVILPPLLGWFRLQGERAGLYPSEFGVAIMVLSMMMVMTVLSYWITHALEREDKTRMYAEALRSSEEKYRSVTESVTDAVISANSQGIITFVNTAFESVFGYLSTEVLGQPLKMLMPQRFHAAYTVDFQSYLIGGDARVFGKTVELAGVKKNGEEFPLELSLGEWRETDRIWFTAVVRDITERQKAEQRFRGLLEAAPDAMVIVNESAEMIIVNAQAEKLFGYSRDELLGNRVEMLIPESIRSRHVDHRSKLFSNPHPRPMGAGLSLYGVRKDGKEFPVEISLGPLETEHGTIISAAIRDISERKEAEEQSRRLQLLSTRQDFLAALMHNLKNPIIGADRVLEVVTSDRFGHLSPDLTRIFSELKLSNRKVLSMMNELIEIYQYETDPRVLHASPIKIAKLVRSCINDALSLAEARRVVLVTEICDDVDGIRVDRVGITRVLENLLDNAIKFSDEAGEVKVTLCKNGRSIELAVHNYGKIISDKEKEALFVGFWKGVAGQPCPPGTGLGLYLCRTIVEGHQGKLICTSEEALGTTFTVVLPITEPRASDSSLDSMA